MSTTTTTTTIIAPPGGASVAAESTAMTIAASEDGVSVVKGTTPEEREQTAIRAHHAAMMAAQQERAAQVAEVQHLRQAHRKQQEVEQRNAVRLDRLRKESLANSSAHVTRWLSTTVVDACDQKRLVEHMRRHGVSMPIRLMTILPESRLALVLPGVTTDDLMRHIAMIDPTQEVIIHRPEHVLHECKLQLVTQYTMSSGGRMMIYVFADRIYTLPRMCVVQ
jgi:hypothetical protein